MDAILNGHLMAMTWNALLAVAVGSVVGVIFGAIPGLTFSMALALLLPFTFGMEATPAIALLMGIYIGGMTGGSVSAILIGIPGTPSAAATVFDGYPMAMKGQASVALGGAVIASVFGGMFSLVVMILLLEQLAGLAIKFGPAEIFALVLFGLSTICGLGERSIARGLVAGVLGLMLVIIGLDPIDGVARLTFGTVELQQGVNLLVGMIGLFAVPQVISTFLDYGRVETKSVGSDVRASLPSWRQLKQRFGLMTRCSFIGTVIGAIPGTGVPIAAFQAYDHARRFDTKTESYCKGELSGVLAPESANNAVTGGTMIPLLSLGIPGDPATAVILGGMILHGLAPGPALFQTDLPAIYAIYFAIIVSYIVTMVVQIWGIRWFVKVMSVPAHLMAAVIIVLCVLGSYAIRNSMFDVYTMAVMGLIGYLLQRLRVPVAPVVLGLVLGGMLENQYRTALILNEGSHQIFLDSKVAVGFFALIVLMIGMQLWSSRKKSQAAATN